MKPLILYTRRDCHLCEDAAAMLAAVAPDIGFDAVDIDSNPSLVSRYGDRVPVIRRVDSQAELEWPADVARLTRFLSA